MANRRKFSSAFKAKVAMEALKEKETLAELSLRYELSQDVISRWKREFLELSSGVFDNEHVKDDGTPTEEVKTLRAKVGELTTKAGFFRSCLQKERSASEKKGLVSSRNKELSVRKQCELLDISRSSFYYKPTLLLSDENLAVMRLMDEHHLEHPDEGVIGMRNMLLSNEMKVNHKRVRRLMRVMDIKAIYPRKNLTKIAKGEYKYAYLLRNMEITRPNQVWSIDITYIAMATGFMYLTAIIDVYSRFIVGWNVGNSLDAEVSVNVLKDAIARYGKPEIVNSDQGCQYTSSEWVGYLQAPENEIKISMDGKGRATDNAWIERFWRTIKRGYVYLRPAADGIELWRGVREYIDYYNYARGHTENDGRPPALAYGVPRPFNVESSKKALHYINLTQNRDLLQNYLST